MELKLVCKFFVCLCLLTFNRTAYGIEIIVFAFSLASLNSFNRTAYGIEILYNN